MNGGSLMAVRRFRLQGPGSAPEPSPDDRRGVQSRPGNLKEQGQQGNTKQNTTHQGYQQDR